MSTKPIVVLTTRYFHSPANKYLSNTLVDEMRAHGKIVHVISIGNVDNNGVVCSKNGKDIFIPFTSSVKYWKFIKLWFLGVSRARKLRNELNDTFDLITFAPLTVLFPIVTVLNPRSRKSICIVFDLFPEHQVQVRHMPETLARIGKILETRLLSKYRFVTGMSQNNKQAIQNYYKVAEARVSVLNLWVSNCSKTKLANQHASQNTNPVCLQNENSAINLIFGGQLVAGRKFPVMLDFLIKLKKKNLNIVLSIYSSGAIFETLKVEYASQKWITWHEAVDRDEFRERVSRSDFGLAITDDRVSLPSIPSKIFEYLSSGTRVFCIVEHASDIKEVISDNSLICVNKFSFKEIDLKDAESFFKSSKGPHLVASFMKFDNKFHVRNSWGKIEELLCKKKDSVL